jgi:hypothetical protein
MWDTRRPCDKVTVSGAVTLGNIGCESNLVHKVTGPEVPTRITSSSQSDPGSPSLSHAEMTRSLFIFPIRYDRLSDMECI